jgi:hypothetical protein
MHDTQRDYDIYKDICFLNTPYNELAPRTQKKVKKEHKRFLTQHERIIKNNTFIQSLSLDKFNTNPKKEEKHRPLSCATLPVLGRDTSFSLMYRNLAKEIEIVKTQSQCIANLTNMLCNVYSNNSNLLLTKTMFGNNKTIPRYALQEETPWKSHFIKWIYVPCNSLAVHSNHRFEMKVANYYLLAFSKQRKWNLFYARKTDHNENCHDTSLMSYINQKVLSEKDVNNLVNASIDYAKRIKFHP